MKLNRGLESPPLDDVLMDMKLTPEVLELPAPRYFLEDRQKVPSNLCWQSGCEAQQRPMLLALCQAAVLAGGAIMTQSIPKHAESGLSWMTLHFISACSVCLLPGLPFSPTKHSWLPSQALPASQAYRPAPLGPHFMMLAASLPLRRASQAPPTAPAIQAHLTARNAL